MPHLYALTTPRTTARRTLRLLALALAACAPATPAPTPAPAATVPPAVAVAPPDTAAESRARAVALLERSAASLGGRAALDAVTGIDVLFDAQSLIGWQQARRPLDSTSRGEATLRYVLDATRQRGHVQTSSVSPGPIRFVFRNVFDTTGGGRVDLLRWRNGDDLLPITAASARAQLASLGRMLPHLAVHRAMTQSASLRDAGERTRGGRALRVVRWREATSPLPVELEIDPESALPLWASGDGPGSFVEYDDYRDVEGVRVPHVRRVHVGGRVVNEQRIRDIDVTPSLDDSLFAVPAGYTPAPPPGPARATRVAGNVYRLDGMPGGYHAAFVVRDTDVVVLEAPLSPAFTDTALRVIAAIAPGRRVSHVMVTHHHNDHVGGLGPWVARGATLVVGAGLEEAIRRQLPDSLRATARFEPIASARTFGRGAGRITAHPVANAHADGNLAYWVPAARVLFQGDLFYIPERGAVPPAFPVTDDLARVVRAARLRVDHVVGVHGRSGSWADVETSRAHPGREQVAPR